MSDTFIPKDNWETRTRPHNWAPIPYGYKPSDEDDCVLIPDLPVVKILEEALDFIDNGSTYREVAGWLHEKLGEAISHQTVSNIWKRLRGIDPNNPKVLKDAARKSRKKPLTKKEQAILETNRKIAAARRSETTQLKKLEKYNQDKKTVEVPVNTGPVQIEAVDTVVDELEGKNVLFTPNPGPQTDFLMASEQEVLYGGSAGGGKSYALLADPVRYFENPNFRGIIFRRTNDELRELKQKAQMLYLSLYPKANWNQKDSTFTFPSGATLWFTYLERDEDVLRYQGQAFTYVAFDELTQYPTPYAWDYMRSRLRDASGTLPIFMRATTNPGGPGHGWVKKMFIDPAPYGEPFGAKDIDTGADLLVTDGDKDFPEERWGKPLFMRRFIPAKLSDNPYLSKGGQYKAGLMSLSENKRRQLLEGDWDVADGAAFPEFRQSIHVCKPFEIPRQWRKFRSCDYGYASHSAVHWFAIDPSTDQLVVYRELYTSKKTGKDLAEMILELERDDSVMYGVLDSSVWSKRGQTGPSIAEEMINAGCRWRPADRSAGSRENGYNRFHEVLKTEAIGEEEIPGIIFFDTCRQIISDLPIIPSSKDGSDDIDDRYASDHAYDSVRYGIMSRPPKTMGWADGPSPFNQNRYRPADSRVGY